MKRNVIRNSIIAGTAAIAMVAAGSLAAPNEAQAKNGKYLGALAVGAFIGGALVANGGYYGPGYGHSYGYPPCYWQKQKVWDPYVGYYVWQKVKVCY